MLLHLASWQYPKKYCLTCLLGIPVLPAKKGKNPLPNQLNQCNEFIKGEKNPFFVFLSLPALHYWPACICLCEPIKSVSLIATNCLTQLACVLIQKKAQNFALAIEQWAVQCAGQSRTERQFTFFPTPCFHPESNKSSIHTSTVLAASLMKKCLKNVLKKALISRSLACNLPREARYFKLQDSCQVLSVITRLLVTKFC